MEFPEPLRSSFGIVRAGDKIYIAGGHVGRYHNYTKERFSSDCHVFDIPSRTWTRISPYGKTERDPNGIPIQGLRLIEYKGNIYGFGGFAYDTVLDYQDPEGSKDWQWYARSRTEVFKYTPSEDRWTLVTHLPRPRSSYVAARVDKFAYLIGGWDGTPTRREDNQVMEYLFGRFHSAIEIIDLEIGAVQPSNLVLDAPLRRAFSSCVLDDQIVLVGGMGPQTSNDLEGAKYDYVQLLEPFSGTWGMKRPMPVNLFSPGACNVEGTIVVAGGLKYDHLVNQDVLLLKPGSSTWVPNTAKPSRIGTFMELIPLEGRSVVVLGGHSSTRSDKNPMGLCEILEIDA